MRLVLAKWWWWCWVYDEALADFHTSAATHTHKQSKSVEVFIYVIYLRFEFQPLCVCGLITRYPVLMSGHQNPLLNIVGPPRYIRKAKFLWSSGNLIQFCCSLLLLLLLYLPRSISTSRCCRHMCMCVSFTSQQDLVPCFFLFFSLCVMFFLFFMVAHFLFFCEKWIFICFFPPPSAIHSLIFCCFWFCFIAHILYCVSTSYKYWHMNVLPSAYLLPLLFCHFACIAMHVDMAAMWLVMYMFWQSCGQAMWKMCQKKNDAGGGEGDTNKRYNFGKKYLIGFAERTKP